MLPPLQSLFDAWIKTDTWHTRHPLDDRRFFKFVWAAAQYGKARPDEGDIEQNIIDQWQGCLASEYLKERARYYASLYVTLCDFVDARPY